MRRLLFLAILAFARVHAADSSGCGCLSPEMREQAARDALEAAQVAVFARVTEVKADGSAKLVVLESFKGPAVEAPLDVGPGGNRCPEKSLTLNSGALVLVFHDTLTVCETYSEEHFLLQAIRAYMGHRVTPDTSIEGTSGTLQP